MKHLIPITFFLICFAFGVTVAENSEDLESDDLQASEFLFWPKFFLAKSFYKYKPVVPVVEYEYKPVTYTVYKPVWTPVQVTVDQPVVSKVAAPAVVVKAPVVKTIGVGVDVGVATASSSSA